MTGLSKQDAALVVRVSGVDAVSGQCAAIGDPVTLGVGIMNVVLSAAEQTLQ